MAPQTTLSSAIVSKSLHWAPHPCSSKYCCHSMNRCGCPLTLVKAPSNNLHRFQSQIFSRARFLMEMLRVMPLVELAIVSNVASI